MNTPYINTDPIKDIYVISDTHFLHENILSFKDSATGKLVRGDKFSSVDEMDEYMIDKWNSVVKPGDRVYHLGDVFMGDQEKFKKLFPKLAGQKRLIVGNHDDIKFLSSGGFFKKVYMWRMFPEFNILMSHVPLHESSLLRLPGRGGKYPDDCVTMYNCHGHIHQNSSPPGPYKNLSVEAIDYTPVHIETLAAEAKSISLTLSKG
jgi:calcineurin-like phosphoesterase family protein